MTEVQLKKFINDNSLECRWSCLGNKEPELLLWVYKCLNITDFTKLIGYDCVADGVMDVALLPDGDIVVDIKDVCLEWDINPLNITKEDFNYEKHSELAIRWEE